MGDEKKNWISHRLDSAKGYTFGATSRERGRRERITLVMSSFLDVDKDEAEKDTVGTTLTPKNTAPPAADVTGASSLGFE
jgi:hypothetical protein